MSPLLQRLARAEILAMASSRKRNAQIAGGGPDGAVRLHLNENPYPALSQARECLTANRYPGPDLSELKRAMARLYGVEPDQLVVTRGADDAIDMLIRSFCRSGIDAIATSVPSFGAYGLFARIQGAAIIEQELGPGFAFEPAAFIEKVRNSKNVKLAFLCSPNNPTGNIIPAQEVLKLCDALSETIVVLDEAYIEFAAAGSLAEEAAARDNLVVLRTLSKAYGLAGARVGCAIGNPDLIELIGRAQPPFPLPGPSIALALATLAPVRRPLHEQRLKRILEDRDRFADLLLQAPLVSKVWPSHANFLLLKVNDPARARKALESRAILARWRPDIGDDVLRLSIGNAEENALALAAFGLAGEATGARRAELSRETRETNIAVAVDLDRAEPRRIDTGIAFYDHMLEQVAAHGGFSLIVTCDGDLEVDAHHSIEDVAIAFGNALSKALGDKAGIGRYGFILPMDEAEAQVLIDLSGRPFCQFEGTFAAERIGAYPTRMTEHVFRSLADGLRAAIHVRVEGSDDHHKTEACFKALGRALRQAIAIDQPNGAIPSTKGAL